MGASARTGPATPTDAAAVASAAHPSDATDAIHAACPADATNATDTEPDALEDLADEIAVLAAHIRAATHRLLVLIAEFDRRGGWEVAGHRSCAHWLAFRTGIDLGSAREKVRTARALCALPRTSAAMAAGRLSFSQVRALTRAATAENEGDLLELAEGATTAQLERTVGAGKRWSRAEEADQELEDGTRVSGETSRRLSCDTSLTRVTHGRDGSVLDVGRRTRTIPPALRRALEVRDRGCRFPGCGFRFAEGHHVEHWADGGETSLANSLLLCRHHHRLVHEDGWRITWSGDGWPTFHDPAGHALRWPVAAARARRAPGGRPRRDASTTGDRHPTGGRPAPGGSARPTSPRGSGVGPSRPSGERLDAEFGGAAASPARRLGGHDPTDSLVPGMERADAAARDGQARRARTGGDRCIDRRSHPSCSRCCSGAPPIRRP